ncbi:MAG: HAD family phosphatase [Anaerolineales bacterium]|nr:HAD family phosphatase [Anaerolineales bacterium]MCZ2123616.1 HAD family phosphatase [Anaerolineales bacterium]
MSEQKITTIIFDFGGVLLKWNPHNIYQSYFPNQPAAIDSFLAEINFMEWNAQQDKGRPFMEGNAILASQFPQYKELIYAYYENWEKCIDGQIDGSVEILRRLKARGYFMYGLSNWSAETFPTAYKKYPFFKLLDDYVLSGDVKLIKPEAEIFRYALKKFGKAAEECLFIDDSEPNIRAAKTLGFQTVHFQSAAQLQTELSKLRLL